MYLVSGQSMLLGRKLGIGIVMVVVQYPSAFELESAQITASALIL